MSRLAYYADFVSMPALALVLVLFGGATLPGIVLGLVGWTLAEYAIHRMLLHRLPLFKAGHDEHHTKPSGRTGVTSWHSLLVFGALFLILPAGVLAGLALRYLAYIGAHHAVHHWRIAPGHPVYSPKIRHAMHHHGDEVNFGVVTTARDRVFRTYRPRR
ncbi:sterol desaturase family protein [Methylobacterium sp. J-043]|nr:sterol desaturase family protein [Methylobacterium sp. J-043]